MIKKKKTSRYETIDLDGPNGNVFYLLGTAKKYGRLIGSDYDKIIEEMTSGDYYNAVRVFNKYFGSFVVLETNNEELLNGT
jgi:hypothetical protein